VRHRRDPCRPEHTLAQACIIQIKDQEDYSLDIAMAIKMLCEDNETVEYHVQQSACENTYQDLAESDLI